MEEAFDAYRMWLGIPPGEQPPHHYRLLGLTPFESDLEVIATAADARMVHLRTFSGPQVERAQRLLNEVAAARLCLLGGPSKAEYDRRLRARLHGEVRSPSPPPPAGTGLAPTSAASVPGHDAAMFAASPSSPTTAAAAPSLPTPPAPPGSMQAPRQPATSPPAYPAPPSPPIPPMPPSPVAPAPRQPSPWPAGPGVSPRVTAPAPPPPPMNALSGNSEETLPVVTTTRFSRRARARKQTLWPAATLVAVLLAALLGLLIYRMAAATL